MALNGHGKNAPPLSTAGVNSITATWDFCEESIAKQAAFTPVRWTSRALPPSTFG